MKRIVLILFVALIGHTSFGQSSDLYIIKMKNGMVLKAELVKVVSDSFVVIRQYGLETKIKLSEVVDITFNETNPNATYSKNGARIVKRNIPDSGWMFGYQIGFTIGSSIWGATSSMVGRFTALKRVAPKTQVGFAIGLDPYSLYSTLIGAITVDARQYFVNRPRSPFVYGNAGYGFNLINSPIENGGFQFGIGMGHSFRTKKQRIFSISMGFKNQYAAIENFVWWNRSSSLKYLNIKRFELKVETLF